MTTITLPATQPIRAARPPRTRSLQGWTQADADAWMAAHPLERARPAEQTERQMRDAAGDFGPVTPRWGAAEVHGIRTRGTTLTPIQEDGWRAGVHMPRRERSSSETRTGRRYGQGRQGTGRAQGLTPFTAETLHYEIVPASDSYFRRSLEGYLDVDDVVRHRHSLRFVSAELSSGPRVQFYMAELDDDHCHRASVRGHEPTGLGRLLRGRADSRGRLLISGGLVATETERLMEITPMITRPAMTSDFIWSLGHSFRREADHYEVDCTDYGTSSHDAGIRDEAFREQLRAFGDIRPGTLGRVLSQHVGDARLDRCSVRSGERALDSALRLAFEETASASDWLSLDVSGTDDDGEESSWIPTSDSLMVQWMQSESDEFRIALEAIDWTQRRLTPRQWECLTAEDQDSGTARVTRHQARSIIRRELPPYMRIRR